MRTQGKVSTKKTLTPIESRSYSSDVHVIVIDYVNVLR